MAVSCVTSPASLGLFEAYMYMHTTHSNWRAGTRECKGIVNRKHSGLTGDLEVILDR